MNMKELIAIDNHVKERRTVKQTWNKGDKMLSKRVHSIHRNHSIVIISTAFRYQKNFERKQSMVLTQSPTSSTDTLLHSHCVIDKCKGVSLWLGE